MKKAWVLILMVLLVPVIGLWAGGEQEGASGEGEDLHFILVNNMATWSHFFPDYSAAQLACDEISRITGDNVTFEVVGPAENDLLKCVDAMESAISKRPDGFMVICWDANVMRAPINKASRAGIPVVTVDADAPDSDRLSYIGTDWYTLGIELAKALMIETGGKGKVAMLGIVGADNMETAFDGFRDYCADFPDTEIVALEHDAGQETESARISAALMQAHPDLAGIAGFDAGSAPGITTAVREAGKGGKVKVVGNDLNVPQLRALEDGTEQFAIGQKRKFFGYWGVLSLYVHLKTDLAFTSDDERAGIANIPPRIVTGFLNATPEITDLYYEEFEKYTEMKFQWGK
jgi:ribose transport system substrate-binding protein